MGAAAPQLDLFAAPAPAPSPAPSPSLFERMSDLARANVVPGAASPERLIWIKGRVPVWLKKAALLREGRPQPEKGAEWRATCLEKVVEGIALRATGGDRVAALRLQLEACQPYPHPSDENLVCHSGPIMAEIRAKLEAAIAEASAQA